jgi:predicted GH43/DUF377 family glycosyl hydrolase
MTDLAERFPENPLLRPEDVRPSIEGLRVECVLNPGAFRHQERTGLLLRVAERPAPRDGFVSTPVLDPCAENGVRVLEFRTDDPDLSRLDPRVFQYRGKTYLTTLSHLRLAWSADGVRFIVDEEPALIGEGRMETFGLEDCRVARIDGTYCLTFTVVSEFGIAVGMATTSDWKAFQRRGVIVPPENKDCALFEEKIRGNFYCLHRPSAGAIGGPYIWLAHSPDLIHWGGHRAVAATRRGKWDSNRVGAGASPIRTDEGWLAIYHGADNAGRYCLGALLLALEDPSRVLARSEEPIMEPVEEYERRGFVGDVVFTNGHIVDGDQLTIYYGASDTAICGARFSIRGILDALSH